MTSMKSSDKPTIVSPVVSGSGVMVVHRMLEAHLSNYRVEPLSPWWGVVPPALAVRGKRIARAGFRGLVI